MFDSRETSIKLLRLVSLMMLALLWTGCENAVKKTKTAPGNKISFDLSKVPRDQPRIKQIFEWDQRIVVETNDSFYRIDIEGDLAVPIFCPGERTLIGISGPPAGQSYALCKEESSYFLFVRKNGDWEHIELPRSLDTSNGNVRLLSDKDKLVLIDAENIYIFAGGKWRQIPYQRHKPPSLLFLSKDDHALLFGNEVFIGHHWGEFGGGLVSLNLDTGKWQEYFSGDPVTGLAISPKGELWASLGLDHVGGVPGSMRVYDGYSWKVSSENNTFKNTKSKNWPFDPAAFDSLGFDCDGNLLVLSGSFGIFRNEGGRWADWIRITPDQTKYLYVSSFFLPDKNTVLIGLYDGGIVVLNLSAGKYDRITMAESFYHWDHK